MTALPQASNVLLRVEVTRTDTGERETITEVALSAELGVGGAIAPVPRKCGEIVDNFSGRGQEPFPVGWARVLSLNPNSNPALNNLASLYSEHFNQLDRANGLASRSRRLFPNDPFTADTLGWILYQKREYPSSLGCLEAAARALFNHLFPLVIKVVRAHLPRRTSEEDLVQAVFMKLFAKLDQGIQDRARIFPAINVVA